MARMVVIYPTPKDVEAFDRHYFEIHVPLAKRFRGLGNTRSTTAPSQRRLEPPCPSDRNVVFRRPCGDREGVCKSGGTGGWGGSPTFCA